jgi:transcriptional regulator
MHPNPAFQTSDPDEILAFVAARAFAHVFTAPEAGLFVAHVPVVVANGRVRFHVAKRNRIADHLAGRPVLISLSTRDGYQSANWYATDDQVPTWHYEAAEIEGTARRLTNAELVEFLDRLSDRMEQLYSPESPWSRAKMEPGTFEAMTRAIVGFEVAPSALRGTRKFNQHKSSADRAATIAGQQGIGRGDIVAAIEELTRDG